MKRSTGIGIIALILLMTLACNLNLRVPAEEVQQQIIALLEDEPEEELVRDVIIVTPLATLTPTPTQTPTLTPTLTPLLPVAFLPGPETPTVPAGETPETSDGPPSTPNGGPPSVNQPTPPFPTPPIQTFPTFPASPTAPPFPTPPTYIPPTYIPPSPPPPPSPPAPPTSPPTSAPPTATATPIPPSVAFNNGGYSVDEGAGSATITVTLSSSYPFMVTVDYATNDDTATAGSDYTATNGTLFFVPGQLFQTFTVPIIADTFDELNETLGLTLSNPTNATLGLPNPALLKIADDDPSPTVRFSNNSYNTNETSGPATIGASLTAASGLTVTVNYTTTPGTATAGSDYTDVRGVLVFAPGQISQTFTVPISNDLAVEPVQTINLSLGNPTNAILGPSSATLSIDSTCTLREAISAANTDTATGGCAAGNGADTIYLEVTGTISVPAALPDLTTNIAIKGPGANNLTIRRNTNLDFRIFTISASGVVTISGVSITNGRVLLNGGGIQNEGKLTLITMAISGNKAEGPTSSGGGIHNLGGTLTLIKSTVSGNSAQSSGGGINNIGGSLTLFNSTVSGNAAPNNGGGIFTQAGPTVLTNSTLKDNMTNPAGGGSGSGIQGNLVTSKNSIVVDNTPAGNCNTPFTSVSSYNLDSDGSCITNGMNNNIVASAPLLGPLQNNGGPTETHALLNTSPAIDAGDSTACPPTDQREIGRPQGSGCDMGAYEFP